MASASQRLERSVERSAFVSVLSRSMEHSTILRAGQSAVQGLPDWFETSSTNRVLHQLGVAWASATTNRTITAVGRWTRSSYLFNWLTEEPEPDVIVIDLRETYTVGPVIALLDRSLRVLLPASHRSTIVGAAESVHQSVAAAPVRAASLVLGAAVLTDLAVTLAIGEPSQAGVVARVVLLGLAALGTRVSMTWDELVESRAIRLLVAALEPPEPPDDGT